MKLLTLHNSKIKKGNSLGYLTGILHLVPNTISGHNVCPKATSGCIRSCLNTAGRGKFDTPQQKRLQRTLLLFEDRQQFVQDLVVDIRSLIRRADKAGMIPCVRINGTSDLPWLAKEMADRFRGVQFYDYTKIISAVRNHRPDNYYLTFSKSENNWDECLEALSLGVNVSVLFERIPKEYKGLPVINGDTNDLRFLDPSPCIVGLKPKGKAITDTTGFVVREPA